MQIALLRLSCSAGIVYIPKLPPTHTLIYNILKYNTSLDVALIVISFIPRYGGFCYRKQNYMSIFLL